ncbi:MAG: hypothetical protein E7274_06770 [Pseudobutyrivibrio ruminis]|uniref:hypothetical protein n=1 Tax=Pseudobutyrivibrio ruminis TaxID=46206 RepID=UPI0026F04F34|nr:hypothetical protein [Pseudobutyrivibrio ruminis]MBE5913749.1 hypothetical protein [Pseudobutyrivibrio ruminis]
MRKNIIALALTGIVTLGSAFGMTATANAAELDATTATTVFDATYYAETYPDVVAVLGTDANALLAHYLTSGVVEGRNASATFNLDAYASANPDLVAVFGDNVNAYVQHYANYGVNENRIATIEAAVASGITVTSLSNPDVVIAQPSTTGTASASSSSTDTEETYYIWVDGQKVSTGTDGSVLSESELAAMDAEWESSFDDVTLDNWTGSDFIILY